ncbi:DUF3987 domain-containing protein [Burkholderia thailandensis]|uniref:DUF3987 domain-containing protein n=1 Tax=Burkholderia thailandensis TaxID=57975 RepID=UPI003F939BF8
MSPLAKPYGGGFMPSQNVVPQQPVCLYQPPAFNRFAGVLDAVEALPPRLKKVVWGLHNHYGVPLEIALGNLLGILSFVSQGVCNVCDSKGDPMPLSVIVHVVGAPASGKSATYIRLMQPVRAAMRDWLYQWEFDDPTPQGIKRESPTLGFCGHEEGDAFFETPFGRDFALQISLRDGFVPVVTRAKRRDDDRQSKGVTRFTILVLHQPDRYEEWLEKYRKKGLGSGFLARVWMVLSHSMSDKSAIGRYPQFEGALEEWDERVTELLKLSKGNGNNGLANLFAMDVAADAGYVLKQAQQRIDSMSAQGVFHQAPAVAARYHERVSVLAALFQLYEGNGRVITREMMSAATVVAEYLLGQWMDIVFPPKLMSDAEQRAQRFLEWLYDLRDKNGKPILVHRKSDLEVQAPNFGWTRAEMAEVIKIICGHGLAQVIQRTENGRRVINVELMAHPAAFRQTSWGLI